MLKILRVEWMKVKNYRTFWILLAINIVIVPAVSYMLYSLMNNSFPKNRGKSVLGSPFAFPDVWQTVSWNSTLTFIVPAILIITLMTNEFTYKTHRQNIIDGWSREQFIGVKLIEVVLLSLLSTVVVLLTTLGFGFIGNKVPAGVSIWEGFRFVPFYFVQMLSYSMIAFLLALLIKRAGLAISVFLIYMLVENIVVAVLRNAYKLNGADYLPEEVTDRLIPQPYLKMLIQPAEATRWEHHLPVYLVVGAVYLLLYCFVASRVFLKNDL
jgi:ABC-type transport system involved in multi-copper enzyme maturation permease subunit